MALPILKRVTERLHEAAALIDGDGGPSIGPLVDLLFAHDSTIFPFVALLDILDLGTEPQSSRAGHLCPFSSRATIALRRSGTIAITYNGVKVIILLVGWLLVVVGGWLVVGSLFRYHSNPTATSSTISTISVPSVHAVVLAIEPPLALPLPLPLSLCPQR